MKRTTLPALIVGIPLLLGMAAPAYAASNPTRGGTLAPGGDNGYGNCGLNSRDGGPHTGSVGNGNGGMQGKSCVATATSAGGSTTATSSAFGTPTPVTPTTLTPTTVTATTATGTTTDSSTTTGSTSAGTTTDSSATTASTDASVLTIPGSLVCLGALLFGGSSS